MRFHTDPTDTITVEEKVQRPCPDQRRHRDIARSLPVGGLRF